MAATYNNSYGAVMLTDGGTPRIITVKARSNISGGYWVNGSSAAGIVGSGAETYIASDIEGYPVSTQVGSLVIGLALTDIASGTYGPVAMRGLFLLPVLSGTTAGSIFAGQPVIAGSAGTVTPLTSGTHLPLSDAAGVKLHPVGRAISTGAGENGDFVVVSLNV